MSGGRVLRMPNVPEVMNGSDLVREGTTGRVVVLPQMWATAAVQAVAKGPGTKIQTRGTQGVSDLQDVADLQDSESEVAFYRKYTEALLRRYQRLSRQAGRVPSPMDREFFRGRMSHYKVQGFDDAVIFCIDVERCLQRLNAEDQRLVQRIAVQQYSMGEAAGVLRMSLRSCIVRYRRALDRTTRLFLDARILEPERSCQEARTC